jgi:hypothetical protein
MGLSFTTAAGPRQRSHTHVRIVAAGIFLPSRCPGMYVSYGSIIPASGVMSQYKRNFLGIQIYKVQL